MTPAGKPPTPSFAVLMCVNRDNPWLLEAINSVLTQDDSDFELLVSANAATDDLWKTLTEVAALDSRVRLFRTPVAQLAFNLNFLAAQTECDYLVRMDADDVCEPHRLRTLRNTLKSEPVDVLGSFVSLIDQSGQVVGAMRFPEGTDDIRREFIKRTVFCHPAVAIRRHFLLDMRGYLGGYMSEDTDLWLRAIRVGATMRNIPEALLRYRIHPNQSISSRLGYAEVAGHWLREFLLKPSMYSFRGLLFSFGKSLVVHFLPGVQRYRR